MVIQTGGSLAGVFSGEILAHVKDTCVRVLVCGTICKEQKRRGTQWPHTGERVRIWQ